MSEWEFVKLSELVTSGEIELGRGNIISRDDISSNPGSYPIYSSSAQNEGKFGEYAGFMFDEELVTWSVDGGGRFFYRPKHKFSVTNVCGYLRVHNKQINTLFCYYSLADQHKKLTFDYTTKAHPSVIRELYQIPLVSLATQQKIARILQTVDQAIEKTEQLIEKYQQIKAGLMHDLFTRGIGADGQLRPPREQAPELYQQTPIGWIPKEWCFQPLENLLASVPNNLRSGPFGSALLKSELVEDGIPFLGIDNIHIEHFEDTFKRYVSESKFSELSKYAVRPKDVIITIMGTVGRTAVVPDNIDRALSSKHLWTMTFDRGLVIPELVCWQLNFSAWAKAWFRRETQGGIMDAIQSKTLRTLILPVPSVDEQKQIFQRYLKISNKILVEEQQLEKLLKQKSGLMHDLLTGTVPVSVDPGSEVNA